MTDPDPINTSCSDGHSKMPLLKAMLLEGKKEVCTPESATSSEEPEDKRDADFVAQAKKGNLVHTVAYPLWSKGVSPKTITRTPNSTSRKRSHQKYGIDYKDKSPAKRKRWTQLALYNVLKEKNILCLEDLDKARKEDPEVEDCYNHMCFQLTFDKVLVNIFNKLKKDVVVPSYKQLVTEHVVKSFDEANRIVTQFVHLMSFNGWQEEHFKALFPTLFQENGKVQTLHMYGPASAGKSRLVDLFTSVYKENQIGVLKPDGLGGQFWLESLVGKEIYVCEEFKVNTSNIEDVKLLFEGSNRLSACVKFSTNVSLASKPVLVTGNYPVYNEFDPESEHYKALDKRMLSVKFERSLKHNEYDLAFGNDEILPDVLYMLYEYCCTFE